MPRQDALDGVADVPRVLHDGPVLIDEADEVRLDSSVAVFAGSSRVSWKDGSPLTAWTKFFR